MVGAQNIYKLGGGAFHLWCTRPGGEKPDEVDSSNKPFFSATRLPLDCIRELEPGLQLTALELELGHFNLAKGCVKYWAS